MGGQQTAHQISLVIMLLFVNLKLFTIISKKNVEKMCDKNNDIFLYDVLIDTICNNNLDLLPFYFIKFSLSLSLSL